MILLRDSDQQPEREQGMNQARDESRRHWPVPIIIGLQRIMRECWVIAGFIPESAEEQGRLHALLDGKQLGFDPTLHPERLTAQRETAKKSAKRVLNHLAAGDREREARCWLDTPLPVLESRGANVGLAAYLAEVRSFLVPLLA